MPLNSKVHKMYDAIRKKCGPSKACKSKAARIAQSRTGKSLMTGRKPKRRRKR